MNQSTTDAGAGPANHDVSSQISRGIVGIYARLYGRGPTRARTHIHEEFVMSILEGSFTQAEQTLLRVDKPKQVHAGRRAFHDATADEFIAVVESATGRNVKTFMSQVDVASSSSVEVFLLESEGGGNAFSPAPTEDS